MFNNTFANCQASDACCLIWEFFRTIFEEDMMNVCQCFKMFQTNKTIDQLRYGKQTCSIVNRKTAIFKNFMVIFYLERNNEASVSCLPEVVIKCLPFLLSFSRNRRNKNNEFTKLNMCHAKSADSPKTVLV